MNTIKNIIYFAIFIFAVSTSQAQEKKTVYYYLTGTAYIDGEGLKAIITNVKSTNCDLGYSSTLTMSMKNQFGDYLKAEYKKYYKYSNQAWTFDSRAKAETERRKFIGKQKNNNYSIIKDIHFSYYCN